MMSDKEEQKSTLLRRRSSNYTTYFANGCIWNYPVKDEIGNNTAIVMNFVYRTTMAGEPFQVTFDDNGIMIVPEHAQMIDSMVLVGVAMPKHIVLKLSRIALEEFGDAVVLMGEEAAAYRKAKESADAECAEKERD